MKRLLIFGCSKFPLSMIEINALYFKTSKHRKYLFFCIIFFLWQLVHLCELINDISIPLDIKYFVENHILKVKPL